MQFPDQLYHMFCCFGGCNCLILLLKFVMTVESEAYPLVLVGNSNLCGEHVKIREW